METNNRSQREKILRNFISGSEFAAIRIFFCSRGSERYLFMYDCNRKFAINSFRRDRVFSL